MFVPVFFWDKTYKNNIWHYLTIFLSMIPNFSGFSCLKAWWYWSPQTWCRLRRSCSRCKFTSPKILLLPQSGCIRGSTQTYQPWNMKKTYFLHYLRCNNHHYIQQHISDKVSEIWWIFLTHPTIAQRKSALMWTRILETSCPCSLRSFHVSLGLSFCVRLG